MRDELRDGKKWTLKEIVIGVVVAIAAPFVVFSYLHIVASYVSWLMDWN